MAAITSAVVGVVGAGVSIGMSVSQANKAAADRRKAQKQAKKAMDEARKETEIMPMQELSLNLAAYEQSREAQQRGVQQVMSQAALDPRQAAAVGGRAMMAGIEAERGIRASQAKETLDLEKIKATERAEASDARKELAIGEAEGAQAAAADAVARQTAATQAAVQAGVEGLGSAMNIYSSVQGPFDPTSLGMASKSMIDSMGIEGAKNAIALNLPEGSSYSYDQVMGMNQNELAALIQSGAIGDASVVRRLNREFDPAMYRIQ
jgi:hypothetical protein